MCETALGAIATFTPVGPTQVPPGTNVVFDVTVSVVTLTEFNTADIIIGSNDAANVGFAYSAAWSAAFANVTSPQFAVGFYDQDVFVGGNNPTPVGATLLLGTVTLTTTGMTSGTYQVMISNTIDGLSNLGLDGQPESLNGSAAFTVAAECQVDGDCEDFIGCTTNRCIGQACKFIPDDGLCPDNGVYCDGTEYCDVSLGCTSTGDPCPGVCNEMGTPHCPCAPPTVSGGGSRYIAIRPEPPDSTVPTKFRVDWPAEGTPCFSRYVGWLLCGGVGERCRTDADCTVPGELCEAAPLPTVDINNDGLSDGRLGVLVDAVYAAELTPAEWSAGLMRCSKSAVPCTVDGDCIRGRCVTNNAICNVVDQNCFDGALCTVDEQCMPGAVYVYGEDVVPSEFLADTQTHVPNEYAVFAECGTVNPIPPATAVMWRWADTNHDSFVNVTDIALILLAIQGQYDFSTVISDDLSGSDACVIQQILNITDVLFAKRAFQGEHYYETSCNHPVCP